MALIAHWLLDEATGSSNYLDNIGGRTLVHSTTGTRIAPGREGNGGLLIAPNDYLTQADAAFWRAILGTGGSFTIAAWVWLAFGASDNSQKGIFDCEAYSGVLNAHALCQFYITNRLPRVEWENPSHGTTQLVPGGTVGTLPTVGAWMHLALTMDGLDAVLYFGGAPMASGALLGHGAASDGSQFQGLRIGRKRSTVVSTVDANTTSDWGLNGLRVYDTALSASEVFALSGGDGDSTAPTVTTVSAPTAPMDHAIVRLEDETALGTVEALFVLLGNGRWEVVWTGSAFAPEYSGSTRAATATGWEFNIVRGFGGWPAGDTYFHIPGHDAAGNEV